MTNNEKENLLKLFLNKPVETPGENLPSYSDIVTYQNNLADNITQMFEQQSFNATPYRILKKGNTSVGFNNQYLIILKYDTNNALTSYPIKLASGYALVDLIEDDNGFYEILIWNNKVWLCYLEDITQPDEDGVYHITPKISYDITSMLTEATGDSNPANSVYNGAIKIHKSPLDRTIFNCYLTLKSNILRSYRVSSSSRWREYLSLSEIREKLDNDRQSNN